MGKKIVALSGLLDYGASELFISQKTIQKHSIPMIRLKKPKKVFNADGIENKKGQVTHIVRLPIQVSDRTNMETMWVTDIGEEDFIIGLTWLK